MLLTPFEDTRRVAYLKIFAIGLLVLVVIAISPQSDSPTWLASSTSPQTATNKLSRQLDATTSYVGLASSAKKPIIYAKQYLLLDGKTAEIIVADDPDTPAPIASMTKMVTALVAITKLPLDQVVTVSSKPPLVQGSKIGLRSGEKITVRNLIQGLLIISGNDAAFAIAETYANEQGNYQLFVKAMNQFAFDNHLVQSHYGDPAGLDDQIGRSTPRELANTARLLLRQQFLAETVANRELIISSVDGLITHRLKNTNRLIITDSPYYLPNSLGVKTGFTNDAGHSLVAAYKWNNRILIGVILNTVESTNIASAVEMNKLFRWADKSLVLNEY